jgi:predicted amidophosphoribosyltransferase
MLEALPLLLPQDPASFSWVPVPPRPGKIWKTGWDQADYLAGRLDRLYRQNCARRRPHGAALPSNSAFLSGLGDTPYLPVCRCLKRLSSGTQKDLNREDRKRNLKGRIMRVKDIPRRVVLFDDVITTGSTLDACAESLKAGGAETVYIVCLFYD